jgi:hypothetical protein
MNNYNYHDGFVRLVALFVLLGLAYIVGGEVVRKETAQMQASTIATLSQEQQVITDNYAGTPEME